MIKATNSDLSQVAARMPPDFWRLVDYEQLSSPIGVRETLRLGTHMFYYGLLVHLHLPPPLIIGTGNTCKYRDPLFAGLDASRFVPIRFFAHRNLNLRPIISTYWIIACIAIFNSLSYISGPPTKTSSHALPKAARLSGIKCLCIGAE